MNSLLDNIIVSLIHWNSNLLICRGMKHIAKSRQNKTSWSLLKDRLEIVQALTVSPEDQPSAT